MEENRKKPQIRFAGYTDDWEQRKVREVADRYDNLRIPVAANLRIPGSTPYYGANGIQDYVDGYTHEGEFILVAEDGANDLKNYPVKCVKGRIWVNNHAHVLQGKNEIADNKFLAFAISQADIESLLVGGSRAKLNAETLMEIDLLLPEKQEQVSIGNYLTNLDHLITLHQRKYNKLVDVKKSMLEKMFPKNGEKKPEIRFGGFTDDWEQRKLGEYVSITSGEAPSKFEEGTELYVKVDDLNYNDKYVVDTQNKVAEHSTVKRVTKGSVVFPKRGAAIMTNKVRIMGIDSYMDTNMMALTSEKLDSEFLYNIISKEGLYKIADTSTIPQINNKHIEPYEVTIPSLDEQRRIGAYFRSLDHLITLHQREVEKLKNNKKSMLEKMFI